MFGPALSHLLVCLTVHAAHASIGDQDKHAEALTSLLEAEKGYFNPKIEMRRSDPSTSGSGFGIFAKEDIAAKSLLFRVPTNIILDSLDTMEDQPLQTTMVCGAVRNLAKELKLGNESDHAAYVNYLLDTQLPGQLPSAWSDAGKTLLTRFLEGDDGTVTFPPEYPIEWIADDWHQDCEGSEDPMEEYAALLVVQRAWDHLLIPVYDMMNHRNGESMNTMSNNARDGDPVKVQANRDIKAGEEIYTTYNMCDDCEERYTRYGTPEILRDHGFVEQYPQSWIFPSIDVAFRIDEVMDDEENATGEFKVSEWIEGGEVDDEESVEALKDLLEEVVERKELLLDARDNKVPDNEWNIITAYANAMELAINVALDNADIEDFECIENGTCKIASLKRYADLDNSEDVVSDLTGLTWPTCDVDALMEQFDDDGIFDLLEEVKSPYQHLSFMMRPDNKETCFDIDNTIQICDSYRPHYHELQVHQTARYLKNMKRVLWVGGGDSMLLHEFLKYPDLELAVGLELDQRVVRGSFKHFGTQPHFENEKVEWWFGDATKSLMMLPKDYFGSFDMVVVDLSETVMSLTVTDELDMIEALTLLLKPDGVFIKNEKYFEQFKAMFPHSVQMHWYENPVICSQTMAMGSYSINFMKAEQTDFGVEGLLIEPVESTEDPYHLYHDYARNHTSREICDVLLNKDKSGKAPTQTGSPGILFIVEAEDATADLSDVDGLKSSLTTALEKEGLTIVSAVTTATNGGSIISFMLSEGYVIARTAPEHKYCGFDIHFWTSLDKHEDTKDAVIAAVGSKASSKSTFRVIAGGIFGLSSWQEEEKGRGPQYEEICEQRSQAREAEVDSSATEKKMGVVNQSTIDSMLEESVFLIPGDSKKVAMLIGNDGKSGSSAAAKNMDNVEVETIYCPSMLDLNEYEAGALDAATACETHLTNTLSDLAVNKKFNVLVIDSTADKLTASILLKIFSVRRKTFAKRVLEANALVVSVMLDESEKWRQNLVQLFKNDVFKFDPTWYVEVGVTDSVGAMKILLANESDPHFVQRLNKAVAAHEKKSGLSIEVQVVDGGQFVYQDDPFEPTRSFLPGDYDQSSPLKQWRSQIPLGHQIIFQMEYTDSKATNALSAAIVRKNLENAISKTAIPGLVLSENTIQEYYGGIGDGCVLMATWSGGSIVVLWDGRKHIDVNFFTYEENVKQADAFEANFRTSKYLSTMLRDEQPRGVGRVVSYFSDLKGEAEPHWA